MLELLNSDMSPIVDYVDVGDVTAPVDLPFVLRNTGPETISVIRGVAVEVAGSDGFERMGFARAVPAQFDVQRFTVAPSPGMAVGDIFDFCAHYVCGWLSGFAWAARRPKCVACVATADPVAPPVTANLSTTATTTYYLRRVTDGQWFSAPADGALPLVYTPATDPAILWNAGAWWGYSVADMLVSAAMPNWLPTIMPGQAFPIIARVTVTGGGHTQSLFRLNPRLAQIAVEGAELL